MYNNIDNNAIFIDTKSSKRKRRKINCVLCFPKVQLNLVNEEECKWRCPRCKNDYQILENSGDLVPEEDELESSHDSDDEGIGLLVANEDEISKEEDSTKSDIKIPGYMKNTETTTVTYFREE
jgi:hypothetical protein